MILLDVCGLRVFHPLAEIRGQTSKSPNSPSDLVLGELGDRRVTPNLVHVRRRFSPESRTMGMIGIVLARNTKHNQTGRIATPVTL
jgi:hypothetical protein